MHCKQQFDIINGTICQFLNSNMFQRQNTLVPREPSTNSML